MARTAVFVWVLLIACLFSDIAHAQGTYMPIGNYTRTYTASQTRGYWFTAPTDFFIVGLRVPTDVGTEAQNIQIMRYNTPVTVWATQGVDFVSLGYWWNVPGTGVIPCNIFVQQGDIIGIIGARGNPGSTMKNSYGQTVVPSNIFGYPMTLRRHGTQYVINDGNPAGPGPPYKPTWTEPNGTIARVEVYYDPPCFVPDDMLSVDIVDQNGNPQPYVEVPGDIYVKYAVKYPSGGTNVTITLDFHPINNPTGPPAHTIVVNDVKQAGIELQGQQMVSIPSTVAPGYYLVKIKVNSLNSCEEYDDTELEDDLLMVVPPGTELCLVWPGDVNENGVVNYGDRRDLNHYIFNANLRTTWLQGPARFLQNAGSNPMTYIEWKQQPGIPWYTPEGCYMDTDGNGVINNFDYIAIKLNWMKTNSTIPEKNSDNYLPGTFGMTQNYPNPFNPWTTIDYSVPERSSVSLTVTDMLGRTVVELVNETVEAGVHNAVFDASSLGSGQYFARISMVGRESGLSFSKTIKMTLSK